MNWYKLKKNDGRRNDRLSALPHPVKRQLLPKIKYLSRKTHQSSTEIAPTKKPPEGGFFVEPTGAFGYRALGRQPKLTNIGGIDTLLKQLRLYIYIVILSRCSAYFQSALTINLKKIFNKKSPAVMQGRRTQRDGKRRDDDYQLFVAMVQAITANLVMVR